MRITHFEQIEAWKAARQLTSEIYSLTNREVFARDLALQRQMRSCATSVMANIAEGFDSATHPEFSRFLKISRRSATELQSHLYVAWDQHYLEKSRFDELYEAADQVKRLIGGFIRYLKNPKPRT